MLKRMALSAVAVGAAAVLWAGAASGTTGSQRFSISLSGSSGPVYASGPISGSGTDIQFTRGRRSGQDKFVFASGSVSVAHQATTQNQSFDPRSCLTQFTESGNYQLLSGTGAYRGVTGSGTYSAKGTSRGCDPKTATSRFFVSASGWTSLP
jgi:hypothetical protein